MSDSSIPLDVQLLLQLGDRFSVLHSDRNKDDLLVGCLKNIECNITQLQDKQKNDIRNRSAIILKDFYNRDTQHSDQDRLIMSWISSTRDFINKHPNILFMNADKGNITVAMHRNMYLHKMNELLSDTNTYEVIVKDPTKKIISDLRSHLSRWKHKGYISQTLYLSLLSSDGVLPWAYGLPKVHKKDCPLRIIVSCLNSSLYKLSVYLHITDNKFIFNWYRKPTFSGRFLNFASQHPLTHKKGVLMGLVDRVLLLSHPQFYQDNFSLIINILLENGYPLHFIFKNITDRIRYHIYRDNKNNHMHNDNNIPNNNVTSRKAHYGE